MSRAAGVALSFGLCLATVTTSCSDPLVFADWTIPVPEGVPVHEYAPVPLADRDQRIELVEDLVIGERDGDDNYTLYNAFNVLAGTDGRIYVLDGGNSRVQVFDADGEYLLTMGREGQGPGEFAGANAIVIAGDRLLVKDFRNRRYSTWTLDGEHLGEVTYEAGPSPFSLRGLADGTMIGQVTIRDETEDALETFGTPHNKLFRYDLDGNEINEIEDFPPARLPVISRRTETNASVMRLRVPSPTTSFATTESGLVYSSLGDEYQVYARSKEGTMRWALRVAWDRAPITEEEIAAALDEARERIPDASRSEVDWPDERPALSFLSVDGHGHLYAFPYPADSESEPGAERAVDVYSPAGEHLFSGFVANVRWTDARGDFVYAREADDDSGEERVIRYRLVEPFDR